MKPDAIVDRLLEGKFKQWIGQALDAVHHRAITIRSSSGTLVFDASGTVLLNKKEGDDPERPWLPEQTPTRLDVEEWQNAHKQDPCGMSHDILDWGYWAGGEYVPPDIYWRTNLRDKFGLPWPVDRQGRPTGARMGRNIRGQLQGGHEA